MIEYMSPVVITLVSAVLFKGKDSFTARVLYMSITFGAMLVLSCLRFGVGFDYLMYSRGFFVMGMDGFSTLTYYDWEWGFTLFTKIVVYFTRDVRVYFAVVSLLCLAGPFYIVLRYSKKPWLSVLLYLNLYFFYCTTNFLRQSIAISITLFAFTFLIKRKIIPYMGIILLAAAFHITALIMVPVYLFANFKPSRKTPILYGFVILWVFIASFPVLDILTEYMYGGYIDTVFIMQGLDAVHVVIPAAVSVLCFWFIYKFARHDKILVTYVNLIYFGAFWMVVMLRHMIIERLSYYAYIYVILFIPEFILFLETEPGTEKRRKAVRYGLLAVVAVVTTAYNIYGLTSGDKGVHGVYPYRSWLY